MRLPKFIVPDLPAKRIPPAVFHELVAHTFTYLVDTGKIEGLLRDPDRRPVDVRFTLHGKTDTGRL